MTQGDDDRSVSMPEDRADSDPSPSDDPADGDVDDPPQPSADIQSYIGSHLRAIFDDVAKQPVPDRFLDLMKRLG